MNITVVVCLEKSIKHVTREIKKILELNCSVGIVVVVAESVAARNLVKENPEVFRIDYIGEPDAFFGILVNKSNSALFEKIQSILNQMYDDGFMKKIEDKWLK